MAFFCFRVMVGWLRRSKVDECIVLRQFSVSAFKSAKIRCLDQLGKGKVVRVLGRVRVQRYTDGNGAERSCWEIIAHEVEVKEDRV